jgi:type VII secretion integral membrane protein EccD
VSENPLDPFTGPDVAEGDGMAPVAEAAPQDTAEGEEERPPAGVDDLCRLNICGPSRRVELAVPAHVPLIDLLPAMIGHLGKNLADTGLEHGGWVLQKLGEPPLQEELSIAALGLHDGDTVHLRPRSEQLPPLDFDDLIDGIAVGIAARPDRWRPETSKKVLTGLALVPLTAGLGLLVLHRDGFAELLAVAAATALLALGAVAARAVKDPPAAGALGAAAIAYAAVAGAGLPYLTGGGAAPQLSWAVLRPVLLAAAAGAALVAAAATTALGGRRPAFVAAMAAAWWITVAAALAAGFRLGLVPVAGVALATLLPFSGWIPILSFRLAGMHLDPLPTTPDELQENLDPLPGQQVTEQTRLADRYQGALYLGLAVVAAACLAPLATAHGWPARAVTLDASAAMLLHARMLGSARQRLAVILPVAGGLGVLAVAIGLSLHAGNSWAGVFGGLLIVGGALLIAALTLPGRKLVPHWGWAGDIFQTLTVIALIPLVLWLLGVFHYARMHG